MSVEQASDGERINPRTRRVRQAILDAAIEVLLEDGARHVTPSRVAERADVARTTIYRHWNEPTSLLVAAVESLTAPHFADANLGSLEADLQLSLERLRTRLIKRQVRQVFAGLAAHATTEGAVVAQRRFIARLIQPVISALQAGRERGELAAEVDCEFEATLLAGPLLYEHLVMCRDVSEHLVDEVVSRWMAQHLDR